MSSVQARESKLARVGVVVVTFESESTIGACLDSLPVEALASVVVVDNASSDRSAHAARRPGVTVVENERNMGFGSAVDTGIATLDGRAEPEFVLVINPDAVLSERDLLGLADYLAFHPDCGLVGPRQQHAGVPLPSAGPAVTLATELRLVLPPVAARRLPERRYPPEYDVSGPVGFVSGACVLIRRESLRKASGFGPGWFLFYEEHDLARRLTEIGQTVDLCATTWVDHRGGVSREAVALGGRPELVGAAHQYLRRWHGPIQAWLFRFAARITWTLGRVRGRLSASDYRLLVAALRVP